MNEQHSEQSNVAPEDLSQVPIAPVPLGINVGTAMLPNAMQAVVVNISTPLGPQYYFLTHEMAVALADELTRYAQQAKLDLIIPSGSGIEVPR